MRVFYSTTIYGICPVDGSVDPYTLTVESDVTIPVEDILYVAKAACSEPAFQEEITKSIRAGLSTADRVSTVGTHSDVLTECEA